MMGILRLPGACIRVCIGFRGYSSASKQVTVRETLNKAIDDALRRDPKVMLLGEEVGRYQGAYKVTKDLIQKYGKDRVVDTPITEMGFAGIAVGAALNGLKPICEFMTFNFAMQAIDQIVNSAGKARYMSGGTIGIPIVFRGPNGSAAGVAAQHSQDYSSWYGQIPGLKVVSPWSALDHKGLFNAAINDPDPVVFLENEVLYGSKFDYVPELDDPNYTIEIGKAKVEREGSDITLVASSIHVRMCMEAAEVLDKEGISVEVINLRSIRPLDTDTIVKSLKKTNRIITVEGGFPAFGLGSEICANVVELAFDYLDHPVVRITSADTPTPYAKNLESIWTPNANLIVKTARKVING